MDQGDWFKTVEGVAGQRLANVVPMNSGDQGHRNNERNSCNYVDRLGDQRRVAQKRNQQSDQRRVC